DVSVITDTGPCEISTLTLHDALPIYSLIERFFRQSSLRPKSAWPIGCTIRGHHVQRASTPHRMAVANESCFTRSAPSCRAADAEDRKSTRLNSSHVKISYAVFCLKKK